MSKQDARAREAAGGARAGDELATLLVCMLGPALAVLLGVGLAALIAWAQGLLP